MVDLAGYDSPFPLDCLMNTNQCLFLILLCLLAIIWFRQLVLVRLKAQAAKTKNTAPTQAQNGR